MKKTLSLFFLFSLFASQFVIARTTNEPDSAYLFAYSTQKSMGRSGLHFAWSSDRKSWSAIGPEFRYLFSDYGRWKVEKRLVTPYLFQGPDRKWHCVWSLNEKDGVFAHAASSDLTYWLPQSYPTVMTNGNCQQPEVLYDKRQGVYVISWLSNGAKDGEAYCVTTKDFKTFSSTKSIPVASRLNDRENILVNGSIETGVVRKVAWADVDNLMKKQQLDTYRNQLSNERLKDDYTRFVGLKPIDATISVKMSESKKISDQLIGVFFEDINYSADGGLYAELIQNRGFEYSPEENGRDKNWNSTKAWSLKGENAEFTIATVSPVHPNNPHYAVLKINIPGAGLINEGFDGIAIKGGEKYDFSLFARNTDGKVKKLRIRLVGSKGEVYGENFVNINSTAWNKYTAVLVATQTASVAKLEVVPQSTGTIALDMISLFPEKTFKGHKNGLRADLAELISDIHPRFVRFPGGCVSHGDGIANIYRWKNTIGPLEARKPMRNLWGYHQSMGLGYYEYFQFCEDMGAEPLPVIAAGVPCQNSSTGGAGQQGGIPMNEMGQYIQDILDLIEWANGDATTTWGKKRAEAGHPKPFNLKYVGIGNEDLITDIFEERFTAIFKAIKEKHPEITVIGTAGPNAEGTDYTEGWNIATQLGVPMIDEHYYQAPGWFINNQDYYDKYDRTKSKVYLGEYASRGNTLANALAEALYMTSFERNGDVVSMTSYAPLLAKEDHTRWNPDMIYFNNTELKPTVNYYVQKLYGQNSGDTYLTSNVKLSDNRSDVSKRIGASVVRDSKTNDLIVKLVNVLPVAVTAKIALEGVGSIRPTAVKTVLTGDLDDKKAQPTTGTIPVSNDFDCALPAYSFTVIRLKTK